MNVPFLNYKNIIENYNNLDARKEKIVEKFICKEKNQKNYVLGSNQHSELLIEFFDIDAVVDDYASSSAIWKGKPIVKTHDVSEGAIVVNCSMSISPVSAMRVLNSLNHVHAIHYSDICRFFSDLPFPDFVRETREDFLKNNSSYERIFSLFSDNESRKIFNDLMAYRLTGDISYMNHYSVRFKDQYFESFLGDLSNSVFIDCGGYDGDTTEEFCRRYPNYKKVYLFEPSKKNIINAIERLDGFRGIEFIEEGLSNSIGFLRFNPDIGSASSISETGSCSIKVTTLDIKVAEKVTLIKMDLEGWEIPALEGSAKHIREDNPILAISVYHHISDFYRIPDFILKINPNYNIYLRHYTEGWSETVMYFIPKKLV